MKPLTLGRSASAGTSESAPMSPSRAFLARGKTVGAPSVATHQVQGTNNKTHKSKFKRALKRVEVPPALQQGIPVIRVFANGQPKQQYLTLSRDKFTLHITSSPIYARHMQQENQKNSRSGSWFSTAILKRTSSADSSFSTSKSSSKGNTPEAAEGSKKRANKEVRTIDIGAIHRIQRGAHNANLKTTTTSAETVQNLTYRRTRSDVR